MVGQGYPENQIEARAYGERFPRASNKTDAGRALNRRIELMIFRNAERTSSIPYYPAARR
jgi:outer membrane protein OmpA-like peptidoglycan-associated protein